MILHTELDPYCCATLRTNFPDDDVLEKDIREIQPDDVSDYERVHWFAGIGGFGLGLCWAGWEGPIWTGGFPCTDISCAGKGAGLDGKQSGLWFEWLRIIRARRPIRLLVENVPALRTRGYDRIHDALDEIGYAVRPIVVGAEAVGAPHRRNRVWIIARLDDAEQSGARLRPNAGKSFDAIKATSRVCKGSVLPDSESNGRRAGSGESGYESEAERRRSEPAGSVQLADAAQRGLGTDGSARDAGHADERGADMVNADRVGCSGRDAPVESGDRKRMAAEIARPDTFRWPMRPGSTQHEWEAPRLAHGLRRARNGKRNKRDNGDQCCVGNAGAEEELHGELESGVGIAVDGLPRRVAGFARRNALHALGNAVCPQVVEAIARAWMNVDREAAQP